MAQTSNVRSPPTNSLFPALRSPGCSLLVDFFEFSFNSYRKSKGRDFFFKTTDLAMKVNKKTREQTEAGYLPGSVHKLFSAMEDYNFTVAKSRTERIYQGWTLLGLGYYEAYFNTWEKQVKQIKERLGYERMWIDDVIEKMQYIIAFFKAEYQKAPPSLKV